MKQVWSRAAGGRPSIVVGGPIPVATIEGVRPLRVPCDLPRGPLGPLLEAQARARRLLGRNQPLLETAADRLRTGLRRTLLGEVGSEDVVGQVVATLNLLGKSSSERRALVLDPVEAADPATLDALGRIVSRPGWLQVPLILGVRDPARSPAVQKIIDAMRQHAGDESIIDLTQIEADDEPIEEPHPPLPADVPADVRRLLRAAALAGPAFEAVLLAELLDIDEIEVLEGLQSAVDVGVPLEDDGDGGFRLPRRVAERLRGELIPSLARAWHRRLAMLLMPTPNDSISLIPPVEPTPNDSIELAPPPEIRGPRISERPIAFPPEAIWPAVAEAEADNQARASSLEQDLSGRDEPLIPFGHPRPDTVLAPDLTQSLNGIDSPFGSVDSMPGGPRNTARGITDGPAGLMEDDEPLGVVRGVPHPAGWPDDGISDIPLETALGQGLVARADAQPGLTGVGLREAALEGARAAGQPEPQRSTQTFRATQSLLGDAARAADHLAAAGDPTGATAKLIQAAVDAASIGAAEQALHLADEALAALDRLPDIPAHRALRARALAEAARIQWTGVGPDARFTLESARETAAAAEAALDHSAPATLHGEVASLRAQILHDLGGDRNLEEALELLTRASRRLEMSGDPIEAARLFNDQAAIWVRLGDPVRAHGLLDASRKVFAIRAEHDPSARLEVADTDHLIARLPLHVAARPGREDDAAALGLKHAGSAEAAYAELEQPWDRARVWETIGRLELLRGRVDRAIDSLERAAALQQRLGDVLGLASTVEALARALTAADRPEVALTLLHDSLALNAEKGSVQGVAFLKRTTTTLTESMSPRQRTMLAGPISALRAELDRVAEGLSPA